MTVASFRSWVTAGLLVSSFAVAGPGEPALVGFRVTEGAAELRVRGASAVSVDEGAGTSVVVHVVGTIPGRRVDRLPLDTSAFGTMLSRVEVVPQARGLALRLSVARGARVSAVVEGASGALVRVEGGTASVRE